MDETVSIRPARRDEVPDEDDVVYLRWGASPAPDKYEAWTVTERLDRESRGPRGRVRTTLRLRSRRGIESQVSGHGPEDPDGQYGLGARGFCVAAEPGDDDAFDARVPAFTGRAVTVTCYVDDLDANRAEQAVAEAVTAAGAARVRTSSRPVTDQRVHVVVVPGLDLVAEDAPVWDRPRITGVAYAEYDAGEVTAADAVRAAALGALAEAGALGAPRAAGGHRGKPQPARDREISNRLASGETAESIAPEYNMTVSGIRAADYRHRSRGEPAAAAD